MCALTHCLVLSSFLGLKSNQYTKQTRKIELTFISSFSFSANYGTCTFFLVSMVITKYEMMMMEYNRQFIKNLLRIVFFKFLDFYIS